MLSELHRWQRRPVSTIRAAVFRSRCLSLAKRGLKVDYHSVWDFRPAHARCVFPARCRTRGVVRTNVWRECEKTVKHFSDRDTPENGGGAVGLPLAARWCSSPRDMRSTANRIASSQTGKLKISTISASRLLGSSASAMMRRSTKCDASEHPPKGLLHSADLTYLRTHTQVKSCQHHVYHRAARRHQISTARAARSVPNFPQLRALALFGRPSVERAEPLLSPASKKPAQKQSTSMPARILGQDRSRSLGPANPLRGDRNLPSLNTGST